MKKHLAVTALSSLLAISAHGAISVTQTFLGVQYGGNTTSVSQSLDIMNTSSVLVIGVYTDTTGISAVSPTFGGVAATLTITNDRATLFYFLNPTTAAGQTLDYTLSNGTNNGGNFAGWELSGVDLVAAVASSTTDSITTLAANSFIVSFASVNGGSALAPAAGSVINTPLDIPDVSGTRSDLAGGSATVGAIGTYSVAWTNDGQGSPMSFAFQTAVPEPSAALLGSLGLLALLRRRR